MISPNRTASIIGAVKSLVSGFLVRAVALTRNPDIHLEQEYAGDKRSIPSASEVGSATAVMVSVAGRVQPKAVKNTVEHMERQDKYWQDNVRGKGKAEHTYWMEHVMEGLT